MKYLGGKQRMAKHIVPFIQKELVTPGITHYYEPFLGAGSVFIAVKTDKIKVGADICRPLMLLWEHVQSGGLLPEAITESEYIEARNGPESWLQAFIGFGCSFGGKWFGGYARGKTNKGQPRNYAAEAKRSWEIRRDALLGNEVFVCLPFNHILDGGITNSVIYCDPPYAGTTRYDAAGAWNPTTFWAWAQQMAAQGNVVFVSEYSAPAEAAVCVFEKTVKTSVPKTGSEQHTRIERLFKVLPKKAIDNADETRDNSSNLTFEGM